MATVWDGVRAWHRLVEKTPLAGPYVSLVSAISRRLPHAVGLRIHSSIFGAETFPDLAFRPRKVTVGAATDIRLTPHAVEFDGFGLFTRRLDYERSVFQWLETAANDYDVVIEIGANVGVYTVFLDKLAGRRLKRIYAFEPSVEAFRRLQQNLAANHSRHVTVYPAAVGEESGFLTFYEPAGHLTNGSFNRDFAAMFSDEVRETRVLCVAAPDLTNLAEGRILLKIDVESYEPQLLKALSPFIDRHRPDILVEVLDGTPEALAGIACLADYVPFLIGEAGPEAQPRLMAHPNHRDWLLRAPALS